MSDPIELELLHVHKDICALFAYRDVNITVWHASGDETAVHSLEPATAVRISRFTRGVSGVHLITHAAGMPTSGARSALVAQARKWSGQTAAVAVVIEHAGFYGSAMRSAVTGIQLLAKAEFEIHVFASVREAADWLPGPHGARTGTVLDPNRFHAALHTARQPLRTTQAGAGQRG